MFNGFTPAAIDFLWGIRFNNNRDWFQEHKVSGITDPDNLPSQKVLTKNGFVFEASRAVEEDHSTVAVYSIQI